MSRRTRHIMLTSLCLSFFLAACDAGPAEAPAAPLGLPSTSDTSASGTHETPDTHETPNTHPTTGTQPTSATTDTQAPSSAQAPAGMDTADAIMAASAAGDIADLGRQGAMLSLELIYTATQLAGSGAATTTGTLTFGQAGSTWSPQPSDRLVVALAEGNVEIVVSELQGSGANPDAFLDADHQLALRLVIPGALDLEISSARAQGAWTATASGTVGSGPSPWEVDVAAADAKSWDLGSDFAYSVDNFGNVYDESGANIDYDHIEHRTGTVRSADVTITLDEVWIYKAFAFDNLIEVARRRVRNTWTRGGMACGWDAYVKMNFKNAAPSELDLWRAEGNVACNGDVQGQLRLSDEAGKVRVMLDLHAGESVELQAFDK